jgi:hypothetical protein
LLGNTPAVTESAIVPMLVATTVNFLTAPITPPSPESVTLVVPTVERRIPGGFLVVVALVKSSIVIAVTLCEQTAVSSGSRKASDDLRRAEIERTHAFRPSGNGGAIFRFTGRRTKRRPTGVGTAAISTSTTAPVLCSQRW